MRIDKSKIKKILVIKPGAIGDVLLSTPVFENLRYNFPDAFITVLTLEYSKNILTDNPFIDRILTYDPTTDSSYCIIKNIRKQNYDLVIDLFGNPRTALITFFNKTKYKIGYRFRMRSYAYNIKIKPRGNEVHNIDFNLDALRSINLDIKATKPYLYLDNLTKEYADNFFSNNGLLNSIVIGINSFGSWETKIWYVEKFIELTKFLSRDFKVLIFWGQKSEKKIAERIKQECNDNVYIIEELSLKYMASLIQKCNLFITNDSGPMHIAWVLGVKLVAIFGPTNPTLQGPLSNNSIVLKNDKLHCLGCNLTRIKDCNFEHKCMKELNVDYVYNETIKLLKN